MSHQQLPPTPPSTPGLTTSPSPNVTPPSYGAFPGFGSSTLGHTPSQGFSGLLSATGGGPQPSGVVASRPSQASAPPAPPPPPAVLPPGTTLGGGGTLVTAVTNTPSQPPPPSYHPHPSTGGASSHTSGVKVSAVKHQPLPPPVKGSRVDAKVANLSNIGLANASAAAKGDGASGGKEKGGGQGGPVTREDLQRLADKIDNLDAKITKILSLVSGASAASQVRSMIPPRREESGFPTGEMHTRGSLYPATFDL